MRTATTLLFQESTSFNQTASKFLQFMKLVVSGEVMIRAPRCAVAMGNARNRLSFSVPATVSGLVLRVKPATVARTKSVPMRELANASKAFSVVLVIFVRTFGTTLHSAAPVDTIVKELFLPSFLPVRFVTWAHA